MYTERFFVTSILIIIFFSISLSYLLVFKMTITKYNTRFLKVILLKTYEGNTKVLKMK